MKKKLFFYFTHKESLGHTTRTLSIIHSLLERYKKKIEIYVFQAGKPQRFLKRPKGSHWFDLPHPFYSKASFKKFSTPECLRLHARLRSNYMLDKLKRINPDVFVTEFFPFGREDCRFELIPVLKYLKMLKKKIYASIGYPYIVRSNFKILLHHCDLYDKIFIHTPGVVEFKYFFDGIESLSLKSIYLETFRHIKTRLAYTGYIMPFNVNELNPTADIERRYKAGGRKLVVVSRGGGGRYPKIITLAVLAAKALSPKKFTFVLVAGPSTSNKEMLFFKNLIKDKCVRNIVLVKYIDDLPRYIKAADVSVSMAGYNTSIQLLYFRKSSVLIPSWVDPETAVGYCSEQISRAQLLKDYIGSHILNYNTFNAKNLAQAIEKAYRDRHGQGRPALDIPKKWFQGAETTSDLIAQ